MNKIIIRFIALLPLSFSHLLAKIIGNIAYKVNNKSIKFIRSNINTYFPQLSNKQKEILIKNNTIEILKTLIETAKLSINSLKDNAKLIKHSQGLKHIDNDKKTIVLAIHLASFDIIFRTIFSMRHAYLFRKLMKNNELEQLFFSNKKQQEANLTIIPIIKNKLTAAIKILVKKLKNNGLIVIMPDHFPRDNGFIMAPFLGIPTKTTTLLLKLAKKYQAQIIIAYSYRVNGGFNLVVKPAKISVNDTIEKAAIQMNDEIGKIIKKYPEQYLWNYRKF